MSNPTFMAQLEALLETCFPLTPQNTLHDKPIATAPKRGYPPLFLGVVSEPIRELEKNLFTRHKDTHHANGAKVGHEDLESVPLRNAEEFDKRLAVLMARQAAMAENAADTKRLWAYDTETMAVVNGPVPSPCRIADKFSCPKAYKIDLQKHNLDATNRHVLFTQSMLPKMPNSFQVQFLLNALITGHETTIYTLMPIVGHQLPERMDYQPNDFYIQPAAKLLKRAPKRTNVPLLVAVFELQPALLEYIMEYITWDEADLRAAIVRYEELLSCNCDVLDGNGVRLDVHRSGYARCSTSCPVDAKGDSQTSVDAKEHVQSGGWIAQCGLSAWPLHYRHHMAMANAHLVLKLVEEEHLHQKRERDNLGLIPNQPSPIQKMALGFANCDTPYKTAMACHSRMLRLAILYPGFRHLFNEQDVKGAIEYTLIHHDGIMSRKIAGQRLEAGRIEKLLAFLSLLEHPCTPRTVRPRAAAAATVVLQATKDEEPRLAPSFLALRRMALPEAPEGDNAWTLLTAVLTLLPTCICASLTKDENLDKVQDVPYIYKHHIKSRVADAILVAGLTRTLLGRFKWSKSAVWRTIECVTHNCAAWSQWCFIQSIKSTEAAAGYDRLGSTVRHVSLVVVDLLRQSITATGTAPLDISDEHAWSQLKKYYAPLLSGMMNYSVTKMKIERSVVVHDAPLKRLNTVYNGNANELPKMGFIMYVFIQQLDDMGLTDPLTDSTRPCPAAHISLFPTNEPRSAIRNVLLVIRDLLYAFSFAESDDDPSSEPMKPCNVFADFLQSFVWSTDHIQTLQAMILVSALPAKLKTYAVQVLTEKHLATLESSRKAPVPFPLKLPGLPPLPSVRTSSLALWTLTKNIVDEAPSFYALAAISCQPHFVEIVDQMIKQCATAEKVSQWRVVMRTAEWLLKKFVGGSAHHIPIEHIKTEHELNVLRAVSRFMYGCGKEPRKRYDELEFMPFAKINSAYAHIVRLFQSCCAPDKFLLNAEFPLSVQVPKWCKMWELNQFKTDHHTTYEQLSTLQVLMLNSPTAIAALLKDKYAPPWLLDGMCGKSLLDWMCDSTIYLIKKREDQIDCSTAVAWDSCKHYYELLELLFGAPYSVRMKSWIGPCTRWAYIMAVRVAKRQGQSVTCNIYGRDNSHVSGPQPYDTINLGDLADFDSSVEPCIPKVVIAPPVPDLAPPPPPPQPPVLSEAAETKAEEDAKTTNDHAAKRQRV